MSVSPAEAAARAVQQNLNEETAKYYGGAIGGLMLLSVVAHWTNVLFNKYGSRNHAVSKTIAKLTRPVKRLVNFKIPGPRLLLSGRVIVALVYFGINIALLFQHLDYSGKDQMINVSKRFGWWVSSWSISMLGAYGTNSVVLGLLCATWLWPSSWG